MLVPLNKSPENLATQLSSKSQFQAYKGSLCISSPCKDNLSAYSHVNTKMGTRNLYKQRQTHGQDCTTKYFQITLPGNNVLKTHENSQNLSRIFNQQHAAHKSLHHKLPAFYTTKNWENNTFRSKPYQSRCCLERWMGRRRVVSRTNKIGPIWSRNNGECPLAELLPPWDASARHKSPRAVTELSTSCVRLSYVVVTLTLPCQSPCY